MPYNKVIFVDSDGTCRSAMIRIIMKSKFLLYPVEFESRGMVVLFPEPLTPKPMLYWMLMGMLWMISLPDN